MTANTPGSGASIATRLVGWTRSQRRRWDAEKELQGLSDERLRDIGVDRADISSVVRSDLARIDLHRIGSIGIR
jgi:uncharacterized protein YjiS (DUF1127 family)